ncbi:uncharacterized protein LOC131153601 isoform X2 [Malania oleifera]|uniref:uncharacterized protein LOC131153601 isoform X2 n=1 Tax=Malania oleifera TaxID=397392 RepID=UPI0025AE337E|nr:uncharacterized protein LOC131153601 isoform X2 [Malania oleifera]
MDEKPVSFESNLNEEDESSNVQSSNNHGWQKVTYAKRQRKPSLATGKPRPNGALPVGDAPNVFGQLEQRSEDRRRRVLEAQKASFAAEPPARTKQRSDDGDDSDDEAAAGRAGNGKVDESKKLKPKKPKRPKITVGEAASKIDAVDLAAFLADASASYGKQPDIQLMRFADYFGRAFSAVSSSQFPWTKMFRESPVAKIVDVAIFVVLAMVLRRKPDVLVGLYPTLKGNLKYQGQDKLPVMIWMIAQACQGDLAVGLFSWAHNLLPIVGGKASCSPQSRDLVLQLIERILSAPKARTILVNGAVRKGERLMPPSSFEILMRVTFPASSARVKATERFEAIYPTLKEVLLACSPGSKATKQLSQQLLSFSVKAAGEGVPELSKEAACIFMWCLTQNPDCYKQWDKIYLDNLEASVAILRKLTEEWKEQSVKQASLDFLRETLKSFRHKNENALDGEEDAAHQQLFKEADKYCKVMLGRLSRGHRCMKGVGYAALAVAVGALLQLLSPEMESWDWDKLSVLFSSRNSF